MALEHFIEVDVCDDVPVHCYEWVCESCHSRGQFDRSSSSERRRLEGVLDLHTRIFNPNCLSQIFREVVYGKDNFVHSEFLEQVECPVNHRLTRNREEQFRDNVTNRSEPSCIPSG